VTVTTVTDVIVLLGLIASYTADGSSCCFY